LRHRFAVPVVDGPPVALALLDALPDTVIRDYQPAWVLRAYCLQELDDTAAAAAAGRRASADGRAAPRALRAFATDSAFSLDGGWTAR